MVASTAAEILESMDTKQSLGIRIDELNDAYKAWRKGTKLTLHYGAIDLNSFGLESGMQGWPVGAWSKFNDTRVLLSVKRQYVVTEVTELALQGVASANLCFRVCYSSGYWMSAQEAAKAVERV